MHRSVWLLAAVVAVAGVCLAAPALAGDNGAQKADFRALDAPASCVLPPNFGRPDNSSAIINRNPAGTEVTAEVQLKDALPNTIYTVDVFMNGCEFATLGFSVITNNQGNRNEQLKVDIGGEIINDVVVVVSTGDGTPDFKQTPMVTFGP